MTDAAPRYHIDLFWSAEDECWVADVPDLGSCAAFGDTPEMAFFEVQVAMRAWLESARECGDPIPKPRCSPALDAARPDA